MTTTPAHPTHYAVIVGITHYPRLIGQDLTGAVKDATSLYDWLVAPPPFGGGLPPDNVTLITTPATADTTSQRRPIAPLLGEVEAAFEALIDRSTPDDRRVGERLYVFLAGHGFAPSFNSAALLLANADEGLYKGHHLVGRSYADFFVKTAMFAEVILVMDCCRGDGSEVAIREPPWVLPATSKSEEVATFYAFATRYANRAFENDGGGYFSEVFLWGLHEAVDADTGCVTPDTLSAYIDYHLKQQQQGRLPEQTQAASYPQRSKGLTLASGIPPTPVDIMIDLRAVPGGGSVSIYDANVMEVATTTVTESTTWSVQLPPGSYTAVAAVDAGRATLHFAVPNTTWGPPLVMGAPAAPVPKQPTVDTSVPPGHLGTLGSFGTLGWGTLGDPRSPAAALGLPSPSLVPGHVHLVVTAPDLAELLVLDLHQAVVAQGLMTLTTDLPPGTYTISARIDAVTHAEVITLSTDVPSVERTLPPLAFASPAPLIGTSTTVVEHQHQVTRLSTMVHARLSPRPLGHLSIFVRDLAGPLTRSAAAGLTLRTTDGTVLVDIAAAAESSAPGNPQPWAGMNIALDPGLYRLRLESSDGPTLEQQLAVLQGWQTHLFFLTRPYGRDPEERRAHLVNGALLMQRLQPSGAPNGFDPALKTSRVTEAGRLRMATGQPLAEPPRVAMLLSQREHQDNPVLALYALANLIDHAGSATTQPPWAQSARRLWATLGPQRVLPDIVALDLVLPPPAGVSTATNGRVLDVPLLRRSWRSLREARTPSPGTPLAYVRGREWGEGIWLVWQASGR